MRPARRIPFRFGYVERYDGRQAVEMVGVLLNQIGIESWPPRTSGGGANRVGESRRNRQRAGIGPGPLSATA